MRFDYDLVIVAANPVALAVAYRYARVGRIGLVLPPPAPWWQWQWQRWWLSVAPPQVLDAASWQQFQAMVHYQQERLAPRVLELAGVDVIVGTGKLIWQPQCHVCVEEDQLYGRNYLLLDAPAEPFVATPPWVGSGMELAEAIAWQAWTTQEGPWTWQVRGDHLVPSEDPWFNDRLQAALEAMGVQIDFVPDSPSVRMPPSLGDLNLHGLQSDRHGWLHLNRYGRTSHPQVYACGAWQRGYTLPSLTAFEAEVIVSNLLLQERQPLEYRYQPWWLPIPTPLARVGYNQYQAQREVHPQTIYSPADPTSWGEMLIDKKGKLLGVTLQGTGAIATSRIFGLCLRQGLSAGASLAYAGWELG